MRHLEGADLREAHLGGADLRGTDLRGSFARKVKLSQLPTFAERIKARVGKVAALWRAGDSGNHKKKILLLEETSLTADEKAAIIKKLQAVKTAGSKNSRQQKLHR